MIITAINTPILKKGDDLCGFLKNRSLKNGDILVVSAKAIATTEGFYLKSEKFIPTDSAKKYAGKTGLTPAFCQAVIYETKRLNGFILNACPGALLTELKPPGLASGSILTANAGLDNSNSPPGIFTGWPENPVASVRTLKINAQEIFKLNVGLIISDSCCLPRRNGVIALALAACGFDPVKSLIGEKDLFGNKLKVSQEAVADQLAIAANAVMGNSSQSAPLAIVSDFNIKMTDFCGWVPGIDKKNDMFGNSF